MKEKMLKFIKERKELLIFLGIILVVFGTVITIAELTSKEKTADVVKTQTLSNTIINPTTNKTTTNKTTTKSTTAIPRKEMMARPLNDDNFQIVRHYFDLNDVANIYDSVINTGNSYENSRGVSYANSTNTAFDVLAVFSGEVINVIEDELKGVVITIEHDNGLITVYSSLSSSKVNVSDRVVLGDVIGTSGSCDYDQEAKIHVHLEMKYDNKYINSLKVYGMTIDEIINDAS